MPVNGLYSRARPMSCLAFVRATTRRALGSSWALSLAFALVACSGAGPVDAGAGAPADAGSAPEPTADQKKALASALHRAHMEAKDEPTACRDCHRIEGPSRKAPYRCGECHDDKLVHVHARLAAEPSLQCLTCHDFLAEDPDRRWACQSCHVTGQADPGLLAKYPSSPLIEVHGKEKCEKCHVPHEDPAVKPASCLECHEELQSVHHAKGLSDPAQCDECHRPHEKASAVQAPTDRCIECHEKPETGDQIVTRAALFKGHDRCVTCHRPHDSTAVAKDCRACHERMVVVGAEAKDHQSCRNCHSPHRAGAPAGGSCVGCHRRSLSDHPAAKGAPKQDTCVACHDVHPDAGVPGAGLPTSVLKPAGRLADSMRRCESCHDKARTDTSFHDGTPCAACHVPHTFDLEKRGAEQCVSCHSAAFRPPAQTVPWARKEPKKNLGPLVRLARPPTVVKVVKGHEKCADCHTGSAHTPNEALAACGSCHEHEPVAKSLVKGHEKCADCHKPHDGVLLKSCVDCHEEQKLGLHAKETRDCDKCHRAHGPKGRAEPVACLECHDKPLPLLHAVKDHRECKTCHAFHDAATRSTRAQCLGACHEEHVNHEPGATTCTGCHLFRKEGK